MSRHRPCRRSAGSCRGWMIRASPLGCSRSSPRRRAPAPARRLTRSGAFGTRVARRRGGPPGGAAAPGGTPPPPPGPRLFAGGAAEFLALAPLEMRERLEAGRAWLHRLGLAPGGFCPPGWLAGPGLAGAARSAGFRYLVTLRGLHVLRQDPGRRDPDGL